MNALIVFLVLFYNFSIVAGTAYLVQVYDWSPWWFLVTIIFYVTSSKWFNKKEEKEEDKVEIYTGEESGRKA